MLPSKLHEHKLLLVVPLQRGEDPHLERRVVSYDRAHVVEAVVHCGSSGLVRRVGGFEGRTFAWWGLEEEGRGGREPGFEVGGHGGEEGGLVRAGEERRS